jgi:hypothetical protein
LKPSLTPMPSITPMSITTLSSPKIWSSMTMIPTPSRPD